MPGPVGTLELGLAGTWLANTVALWEVAGRLRAIDLSGLGWMKMPFLPEMMNLEELALASNPIRSLPAWLPLHTRALQRLNIRNTNLTSLPTELRRWRRLRTLDAREVPSLLLPGNELLEVILPLLEVMRWQERLGRDGWGSP